MQATSPLSTPSFPRVQESTMHTVQGVSTFQSADDAIFEINFESAVLSVISAPTGIIFVVIVTMCIASAALCGAIRRHRMLSREKLLHGSEYLASTHDDGSSLRAIEMAKSDPPTYSTCSANATTHVHAGEWHVSGVGASRLQEMTMAANI